MKLDIRKWELQILALFVVAIIVSCSPQENNELQINVISTNDTLVHSRLFREYYVRICNNCESQIRLPFENETLIFESVVEYDSLGKEYKVNFIDNWAVPDTFILSKDECKRIYFVSKIGSPKSTHFIRRIDNGELDNYIEISTFGNDIEIKLSENNYPAKSQINVN